MTTPEQFDAVCADYAMSKFASVKDAMAAIVSEVAALRAENAALRSALEDAANALEVRCAFGCADEARAALAKEST